MRILLLLAFWIYICSANVAFKTYTLLQPDIPRTRGRLLDSYNNAHESHVEKEELKSITDTHIFTVDIPDIISDSLYEEILGSEISSLAHRLASMDSVMKEEGGRVKCHFNKDALLASFKSKWLPFGWTTYSLVRNDDGVSESDAGECEVVLRMSSLSNNDVVEFKALFRRDRTVQCVVDATIVNLDKRERKALMGALREVWTERVFTALCLAKARIKQSKRYRDESEEELKRRKERKLDRVINPDKYKAQSPTVRRTGASRYDPSQGARERANAKRQTRIVRRGGGG